MFLLTDQIIETGEVIEKHISVAVASDLSSYSIQYLRRLLRSDVISGIKIGQIWLINSGSLEKYLQFV